MNAGIFCASYTGILVCTEYDVTCASGILFAFLPAVALLPNRRKTYQTEVRTKTPSLISTVSPPLPPPALPLFFFFTSLSFFVRFVSLFSVCPPSLPPAVFSFIFLSVVWCVSRPLLSFFFVFPLSLSFSFLQTRQRQKGGLLEGREATDETGIVVLAAPGHLGGRTDLAGTVEAAATATTARPMSMVSLRLSPPPARKKQMFAWWLKTRRAAFLSIVGMIGSFVVRLWPCMKHVSATRGSTCVYACFVVFS